MIRSFTEPAVDLADVQGNILRGYAYPYAAYLWIHVGEAAAGRAWIGRLVSEVTDARPWREGKPATTLNLAFTYAGLEALGLPPAQLAAFPPDFIEGMAARAGELGDQGEDGPDHWEPGYGTGAAHVLVMVNALEAAGLDAAVRELRAHAEGAGLQVTGEERAAMLDGPREHFGFSDGFSQPAVQGDGNVAAPGHGTPEPRGKWSELPLGEFLLGYVDQDEQITLGPRGPLGTNGTFMVFRKLRQDVAAFRRALREHGRHLPGGEVAAFRRALREHGRHLPGGEEQLAAKIMGRWRDGTPLVLSPDAPDPDLASHPEGINDFRYGDDAEGLRCPLGAHVRRANPRDALGWHGLRTRRHRMIRRGMPYGTPLPDGVLDDDGQDRGLIFVAFCASLRRQFEIVQAQWLGDGNLFGLGDDRDWVLLADDRPLAKMTLQGDPPRFIAGQPRFVTVRGGEYLLVPSVSGLRALGT